MFTLSPEASIYVDEDVGLTVRYFRQRIAELSLESTSVNKCQEGCGGRDVRGDH